MIRSGAAQKLGLLGKPLAAGKPGVVGMPLAADRPAVVVGKIQVVDKVQAAGRLFVVGIPLAAWPEHKLPVVGILLVEDMAVKGKTGAVGKAEGVDKCLAVGKVGKHP